MISPFFDGIAATWEFIAGLSRVYLAFLTFMAICIAVVAVEELISAALSIKIRFKEGNTHG